MYIYSPQINFIWLSEEYEYSNLHSTDDNCLAWLTCCLVIEDVHTTNQDDYNLYQIS